MPSGLPKKTFRHRVRRRVGRVGRIVLLPFLLHKADARGMQDRFTPEPPRKPAVEAIATGEPRERATRSYPREEYHGGEEDWEIHKDKKAMRRKRDKEHGWAPYRGRGGKGPFKAGPKRGPSKSQVRGPKTISRRMMKGDI